MVRWLMEMPANNSPSGILFPKALFLIPLTRFPGFVWLIAAGLSLPRMIERAKAPQPPADVRGPDAH